MCINMQNMCIWGRVKEVKPKNVGLELIGWAFGISEEKEKRGPSYVQGLQQSYGWRSD